MVRRRPVPVCPEPDELHALLDAAAADLSAAPITSVSVDTRSLQPGALFIALRGLRFDGHDFVAEALHKGAVAAVVARDWRGPCEAERCLLRVDSPLQAYQQLGCWRRQQLAATVVAITGSVGKTTTKQLVAAALAHAGPVLCTPGNLNHETGVPATLLQLQPEHRFAVIEMGMRGAGQIRELAQTALPDVAVITNVGTAHLGLLGSRAAIARAECELLQRLDPQATAILNADCPLLLETAAAVWHGPTVTFGLEGGDVRGQLQADGVLRVDDQLFHPPLPGAHQATNLLAALAVARVLGVPWHELRRLAVELPPGRGQRVELADDIVLLDETYNAGPESMLAAMQLLAQTAARRRIAVLGTMAELGSESPSLHRKVGEHAARLGLDLLLVLAEADAAQALLSGAGNMPSQHFDSVEQLTQHLRQLLRPGDRVLFKASRAVGLERVVHALQTGRANGDTRAIRGY